MSKIEFSQAHPTNFTVGRNGKKALFLVVHYTANNGDTAKGNTSYFSGGDRKASAHYFVDESDTVWQTVRDEDTAWHCGAKDYKHQECRNINSIGIEMCSRKDNDGRYYIKKETVSNTVALVKELMAKHKIPAENVIRHYDVTGKLCPEPFVREAKQWDDFKKRLTDAAEPKKDEDRQKDVGQNDVIPEKDLQQMSACGVISSPVYWQKVKDQSVKGLFTRATECGLLDERINNGIGDFDTALKVLSGAGIIDSADEWKKKAAEISYTKELLINMANRCKIVLQKIVHAEARGEGMEGQLLVANVILNRQKDQKFPNGIYDIVFACAKKADKTVYQFSPVGDGAYDNAVPSESVKKAVDMALDGADKSMGATYFCTNASARRPESWHEKALKRLFTHGNHVFYTDK